MCHATSEWASLQWAGEALCVRITTVSAGAIQTASTNHPELVMHERYYYTDGTVSLEVEGFLYNVHRYIMAKDSPFFVLHHDTSDPIFSPDITKRDLDIFPFVFYPRNYGDFEASTLEEWSAILRLSDKWGFKTIKNLAVSKIAPIASPIDMVVLGRRYSIDSSLLLDAYDAICLRPAPLTLEEGNRVGMEDVAKIMAIRQEFDLGSRTFIHLSRPSHIGAAALTFRLLDGVHEGDEEDGTDADEMQQIEDAMTGEEDAREDGLPFVHPYSLPPLPPFPTIPDMAPDSLPNNAYHEDTTRSKKDLHYNSDISCHEALGNASPRNAILNVMEHFAADSGRISISVPADSLAIEDTEPGGGRPYWPIITRGEYVARLKRQSAGAAHGVQGYCSPAPSTDAA